jgi:hypothetical protein
MEPPSRTVKTEPAAPAGGRIEIELPDGVCVRVDGSVEEEGLRRVLRVLGRCWACRQGRGRRLAEKALTAVIQEAYIQGIRPGGR